MKWLPFTSFAVCCPTFAMAAGAGGGDDGFSFASGAVHMIASLAVVVGLILVFQYVSRKWLKGPVAGNSRAGYIRIVESRFLAPKKALLLVEVSGEYMLLGSCGDNVNFIKQIDMIEDVEVIGDVSPVSFSEALRDRLKGLATRVPAGSGAFLSTLRKGVLQP